MGTDLSFCGSPTDAEYYIIPGNASTGCCTIHVNADFRAFCDMVDRLPQDNAAKTLFIADRGFASFNAYAHVIEKGAFFLICAKEAEAEKLVGPLPGESDATVDVRACPAYASICLTK